ncbi:MAG: phosphatidylglycerophosphatase A [Rhodospirillaceae bacterium]|nr:phosphatidylglycerophosphatase A [Rhodospirillaceae bacterium]|tara:strand:+ start:24508 stop:24981 length:474 start_codon:yes stop_codon:yes gene_type:complete
MFKKIKFLIIRIIVTWFGIGSFKYFPGTLGSIASLPFAALLVYLGGDLLLIFFTIFIFFIGVYISDIYSKLTNKKDPSEVVIDEVAGQWMVLVFVPLDFYFYLLALLIFRFFDILKPWPIKFFEKKYDGGFGIMFDDILAAGYSVIIFIIIKNIFIL